MVENLSAIAGDVGSIPGSGGSPGEGNGNPLQNYCQEYRDKFLGSKVQPIAQFGIDVPLSRDLFTGATLPIIRFNTRTGNIESISK